MFFLNQNSSQKIFLYTDASFNPSEGFAVSGFLFFNNETSHINSEVLDSSIVTQTFKVKNNIRAEIKGGIHCLEKLNDEIKSKNIDVKNLEINLYSDCQTLTNLLVRREKLTAQNFISGKKKTELANADLYRVFYSIYDEVKPNIYWVRGHASHAARDEVQSVNKSLFQKNFKIIDQCVRKELRAHSKLLAVATQV